MDGEGGGKGEVEVTELFPQNAEPSDSGRA